MSDDLTLLDLIEDRGNCGVSTAGDDLRREASTDSIATDRRSSAPRSLEDARVARDEAMQCVDDHAPVEWKETAWDWLVGYLQSHREFFPDDVWRAGLEEPPNARALGPLVKRAAAAGLIVKTDRTRQRTRGHATPAVVWRSLVYREESA